MRACLVRLAVWLLSVCLAAGACLAVNYLCQHNLQCWESYVGQDVYRLVIVDFIFCLLGSFCGEYLYKCVGVKPAEFDVARNVLDLINAQTLACIRSCHPPSSWRRVGQMQTLFISLLFLPFYLGTLALLAYTLWGAKAGSYRL
ncbi:unnamed protein product [Coregonus sp. 'balchen']|nr:unnamed protein product [Coregonus sp. 'balchen']